MHNSLFHRRNVALTAILLCLVAVTMAIPGGASSTAHAASRTSSQADSQAQDIIYMRDGRELTGKILSEDSRQVVFRYIDPILNLQTTITLERRDILEIQRDVIDAAAPASDDSEDQPLNDEADLDSGPIQRSRPSGLDRGLAEGDAHDESLPAFYVIPMKGQMGTDIRSEVYRPVVEEIRREKPELVIWIMDCADIDELMISMSDRNEQGMFQLYDDYRDLVRMLHDELSGVRQVMWVHDSVGVSSLIALAWPEMYMTPNARLTGFRAIYEQAASWSDPDVAAKMVAAWVGFVNGFLQRGGRALELGEAMTRPHHQLSASWRGREVEWRLDTSGEYIVNASTKHTVSFRAKTAEDFGVSSGTAESLDDLALLLGYREYRVLEGGAEQMVKRYVENWRRAYENAKKLWQDFHTHTRWASGDDTLRWLGRARNDLSRIISLMRRYPAIELRFAQEYGVNLFVLEMMEEQLRDQIRALNDNRRPRGGGGRGGGGGGLGPGSR